MMMIVNLSVLYLSQFILLVISEFQSAFGSEELADGCFSSMVKSNSGIQCQRLSGPS